MTQLLHHKGKIAQAFNRAAESYDEAANLQKRVGQKLISILGDHIADADCLLDLGAGTGMLTPDLCEQFPACQMYRLDIAQSMLAQQTSYPTCSVCADFDNMPFCHQPFDIIFSSMALQWSSDLKATFQELARCLKKNGLTAMSLPVNGTLKELLAAYQSAGMQNQINQFYTLDDVELALRHSGLVPTTVFIKTFNQHYDCVLSLFKFFKATGAYSKTTHASRFISRSQLNLLNHCYLKYEARLSATFEIAFIIAEKI